MSLVFQVRMMSGETKEYKTEDEMVDIWDLKRIIAEDIGSEHYSVSLFDDSEEVLLQAVEQLENDLNLSTAPVQLFLAVAPNVARCFDERLATEEEDVIFYNFTQFDMDTFSAEELDEVRRNSQFSSGRDVVFRFSAKHPKLNEILEPILREMLRCEYMSGGGMSVFVSPCYTVVGIEIVDNEGELTEESIALVEELCYEYRHGTSDHHFSGMEDILFVY